MKSIKKNVGSVLLAVALLFGITSCELNPNETEIHEHTFGEWILNDDATTWADGTKSRICSGCSFKESVTVEGTKLSKPDFSKCKIGDIVLINGTVCTYDEFDAGTNKAAAVIIREATETTPALGVGIVHDKNGLEWCVSSVEGYTKGVEDLKVITDGSNGWNILKNACSDAENHPEYYPAWNYSLTYAEKNGLKGELADGWYLPAQAEILVVFSKKVKIDSSLIKVGGNTFDSDIYWTCNQRNSEINSANSAMTSRDGEYTWKYYKCNVCSVRVFE